MTLHNFKTLSCIKIDSFLNESDLSNEENLELLQTRWNASVKFDKKTWYISRNFSLKSHSIETEESSFEIILI